VSVGLSGMWGDSVGPQDPEGARLATGHLLGRGHQRIACVRTPLVERSRDQARSSAYRDAMRRRGLQPIAYFRLEPRQRVGAHQQSLRSV